MALSSKYIGGIQIEIGGNTTKLKTALDQANKSIRTTQMELDTLQSSLKLEWNADNFKRAQELSQRVLEETRKKADALRQALAGLEKEGKGPGSETYEAIRRELSYVEVAAQKAQTRLEELNNTQLTRLQESISEAGSRLSRLGSGMTAGITLPLAAAGAASVQFASDTEEAVNKVDVAFQDSADIVKRWSETTLTAYGLARGTALDMAAIYGDMATSMGIGTEAAAQMSMALVGLAGDLASFKNADISQVNTALKSIFTGETESLKELGVVMTQANLEAYALAEGYKTAYTEMDQAQQVMVRYQYVLDKTQNAQGDFARTSESTANQTRILKESLKEAAATAGEDLLPVITPLIRNLGQLVQSFSGLDEGTRKVIVQAALFTATLGPALKITGSLTSVISSGIQVYQGLKNATTAAAAAQTVLNTAMSASPVGAVVTAVGSLVAVLGSLAAATALTSDGQESLAGRLQDTVKAGEQSVRQIQEDTAAKLADLEAVRSLLPELEALNEETNRTQAQQEQLNAMVAAANDLYPGLIGQVDALTGSYDINREAIERNIDAMQRQLELEAVQEIAAEKYRTLAELKIQLSEANEAYAQTMEQVAAYQEQLNAAMENDQTPAVSTSYLNAIYAADGYRETIAALEENIARLEEETQELISGAGEASAAMDDAAGSAAGASAAMDDQADTVADVHSRLQSFAAILDTVRGGYDLLTQAQDEMTESGYLSIDTLTAMLEQYPDLISYLEATESGYRLTEGALQAYIAAQSASYKLAYQEAQQAAQAIVDSESAKGLGIDATTNSIYDQLEALARLYEFRASTDPRGYGGAGDADRAAEIRQALADLQEAEEQWNNYQAVLSSLERDRTSPRGSSGSASASRDNTRVDAYQEELEQLQFLRDMDQVDEEEYYAKLEELRDTYLEENSDKWRSVTVELYEWRQSRGEQAYEEELADLKYYLDMDIISEEEYYQEMARLRDTYLEENSEAWRQANVALYNYQQQCREEELRAMEEALEAELDALKTAYEEKQQLLEDELAAEKKALKDSYDAQKEAAKAAYEEKKAQIQEELRLEKERLNAILEGIEDEIQARRELREDEDLDAAIAAAQKRLDAAKAQLAFARTDEDRAEWEKEIVRLEEALQQAIQDKEDTEFYRQKEEEKEAVQDQITAAEEKADAALEAAEKEYDATIDRLEAEYAAAVERLEAEYAAAQERLEKEYQDAVSHAGSSGGGGGGKGGGGGIPKKEYPAEVYGISAAQGVDMGVAYDMYLANQRNNAKPGDENYYYGAELVQDSPASGFARRELQTAAAAAAAAATTTVNNTRNNSASITYNAVTGLTEGQVARTVEKVLQKLSK